MSTIEPGTTSRKSKRECLREHCEKVENSTDCARLQKVLSMQPRSVIQTIQKPDGSYTTDGKETMEELFRVHFPGSNMITDPPPLTDAPPAPADRSNWRDARKVVTWDKLMWAINSFSPQKTPGPDKVYPVLLQKGTGLLHRRLCLALRASLALGYIPRAWQLTEVVFIPKPEKTGQDCAKAFRPICLMSFILKTLEKLLDRHIRDNVLGSNGLDKDQHAYSPGKSTITALQRLVGRVENTLDNKEVLLAAFLDIEGAFDNTPFPVIAAAMDRHGVDDTCKRWIQSMLQNRTIRSGTMGQSWMARVAR